MGQVSRAWRRAHVAAVHGGKALSTTISAGLRYGLAMHESLRCTNASRAVSLSDGHQVADCGFGRSCNPHLVNEEGSFRHRVGGPASNARPEGADKLVTTCQYLNRCGPLPIRLTGRVSLL